MEFSTSNLLLPNIIIDTEKNPPLVSEKIKFPIIDEDKLNLIEDVDFGIINKDNLSPDQKTSSNIWLSFLDKYLIHITNGKFDLACFENQSFSVKLN